MPSASSKQASQTFSAEGTDAMRQSLAVIEKKIRNLEKRKVKLDSYKTMVDEGKELNKDQCDAIAKFDEVVSNLEFAKDLVKQFESIRQEGVKQQKKVAKREQLHRQEYEQKRIKSVLELQDVLEQLGSENIRKDFSEGSHNAVMLTEEELKGLDDFYKLVSPTRESEEGESNQSFSEKQTIASDHLLCFLDAKPKDVCGTTYKALKDIVDRVLACGYLENIPSHSENGEAEAEPEEEVEEKQETEEYVVVESDELPAADAPEVTSSLPPELPPTSTEDPSLLSSSNGPLITEAILPPAHKPQRDVNEVLAAVQGDFNFMQESMIDFQSPHMDPAVVAVASQPLLPPQQNTQTAIPQSSQDPSPHTTLEQLSHQQPSIEQLTQTTSALESVMRSSSLPQQSLAQEQYSSTTTEQSSSQQHSNLVTSSSLGSASMLGQQSLVSAQTVPLSSADSQTMSAPSHMSQTLPPQSMTGPSQLGESTQLTDSLSSQLSSVQNPSSMTSTSSDPSQSMTLSHEQSQTPQEQTQPAPAKPSQINVNAPPFQSMNYMRQQPSYMQPTSQAQIVTSQQLEYTDQSMQQSETQYYSQQPTLQDTQSAHDPQMTVQSTDAHAPGSYPHQHPGMGQPVPGGYQRPTSAGRGNGRGGRGSRGAGGSTYRGNSRPPFNSRNGGYSTTYQPRDYQSSYIPQDRSQYGPGGFSQQSGYKRGGSGGVPPRGGAPRGRGTAPRGGNNRGRGGFPKPNQTPVTA